MAIWRRVACRVSKATRAYTHARARAPTHTHPPAPTHKHSSACSRTHTHTLLIHLIRITFPLKQLFR